MGDKYIDLTTEQLVALCSGLSLPDPFFLQNSPISGWTDEIRQEIALVGFRSLIARQLVQVEGEQMHVPQTIEKLCKALTQPETVNVLSALRDSQFGIATLALDTANLVMHQVITAGNHRLRMFERSDEQSVISQFFNFSARPAPDGEVIEFDSNMTAEGDQDELTALLTSAGFGPKSAACSSTALSATGTMAVEGGRTVWLCDESQGCWIVEEANGRSALSPNSEESVLEAIVGSMYIGHTN